MQQNEPKQEKTIQHQKERLKKLLEIMDKVDMTNVTIKRGTAEPRNKGFQYASSNNP